jgi:hypothetical protein
MNNFKPRTVTQTTTNTIESLKSKYGPNASIIDRGDSFVVKQMSPVSGNALSIHTVPKTTSTSAPVLGDYFQNYINATGDVLGGLVNTASGALENSAKGLSKASAAVAAASENYADAKSKAASISNFVKKMEPNIEEIENASFDMNNFSDNLMLTANELYSMSASDPNSLIGQYINSVKQIDPNRYVSMAASDTQNSFANVQGQLERSMSRQGMSASAQAAALQKNWGTALASALAGAKTKARQTGISERLNALKESVGLANEMQKQAAAEKESFGKMQLDAVDSREKQINSIAKAGQLTQAAAAGLADAVQTYNQSMGVNLNATELMMNAQGAIADFYATQAGVWADIVGADGIKLSAML